jgi:DNA polymerase-3 subunit epsilon
VGDALRDLEVLALDGQASGATPAYGDLIELGWAVCTAQDGLVGPVQSRWIVPRTDRPIARAVRELTGWSEACLAEALGERAAWTLLRAELERDFGGQPRPAVPTVIHFARFETRFLRDLHQRLQGAAAGAAGADFPLDAICLHAVARRLLPDLPRCNIRALAGYFGHAPELVRRCSGHVEATAFIWRGLVPLLESTGIRRWDELETWLAEPAPAPRSPRRSFPLAIERRRALPDAPGVYRFVRPNGDVVYVGKAVSLRRRVAGHFKSRGPATERSLELLSQVSDVAHTETSSLLEAALLETDEIKRLDPPYNVQFRAGERSAWFASRDLRETVPAPDAAHPVGPLPSPRVLRGLVALTALAGGSGATPDVRAAALAVPVALLPDETLFDAGWAMFAAEHLARAEPTSASRVAAASLALWLARGRTELESDSADAAPSEWDLARVRRRLERTLVQTGLLLRRSRLLSLLVDASVAFREPAAKTARGLVISAGEIVEQRELAGVAEVTDLPARRPRPLRERQRSFDAAAYDRLRVLVTELRRVLDEGGDVSLRIGSHRLAGERLARVMRAL